MHEPKVSALCDRVHYVTECINASSQCVTLKNEMSAGRVLNVLLLVT